MTAYATHHFEAASRYTVSVGYDRRLYAYDVAGSIAHARMLARQGVIAQADADAIADGLEAVRRRDQKGGLKPSLPTPNSAPSAVRRASKTA